jgi:hypothetical protein
MTETESKETKEVSDQQEQKEGKKKKVRKAKEKEAPIEELERKKNLKLLKRRYQILIFLKWVAGFLSLLGEDEPLILDDEPIDDTIDTDVSEETSVGFKPYKRESVFNIEFDGIIQSEGLWK